MEKALVVFQDMQIRRKWHNNEWYFSVVDIIEALTDSNDPKQYIKKLRSRDLELNLKWGTICTPLEIIAPDGKLRKTNCSNTKGIFRLIQSIPSKKAEPFKQWLAKVGYERVQEIENPELAQKRMRELYQAKGYSDAWIEQRLRGIIIRNDLTDEWKDRNVKEGREFAILTDEISKATFGKTVQEYKEHKGLDKQNLRDHMGDLELIFNMLGEKVTTEITRNKNMKGFEKCQEASKEGGEVAGNARKDAEKRIGKGVVTDDNYLDAPEREKRRRVE